MNSDVVVITSIQAPTEAVRAFADREEWQLIVVGDAKTPAAWESDGVTYLSPEWQRASRFDLAGRLPWNHYARKMIGYLRAMEMGAQAILDTDDDNLPKPHLAFRPFDGRFEATQPGLGFVNVYRLFTARHIWPRGLPLPRVLDPASVLDEGSFDRRACKVGVWQGLADGDPDVDAIYRLTIGEQCTFEERAPIVLSAGTISPFNSQNTVVRREVFPLLYLPALVTFRFTDILRGLVAQPIMWAHGFELGFTDATVVQERNEHDYLRDFESELPCFLLAERVVEIVTGAVGRGSISADLVAAYAALVEAEIVPAAEIAILDAWLKDLSSLEHVAH